MPCFERKHRAPGRGRVDFSVHGSRTQTLPTVALGSTPSAEIQPGRPGAAPVVPTCPNAPGVDAVGQDWTSAGGSIVVCHTARGMDGRHPKPAPYAVVHSAGSGLGGVRSMVRPVSAPLEGWERTHPLGRSPPVAVGRPGECGATIGEVRPEMDWRRHARTVGRDAHELGIPSGKKFPPWLRDRPNAPQRDPRASEGGGCQALEFTVLAIMMTKFHLNATVVIGGLSYEQFERQTWDRRTTKHGRSA